ncbi:MAG: hypothetical protein Q9219_005665 [cf. Caloplaca sp. 3 TL-2023]
MFAGQKPASMDASKSGGRQWFKKAKPSVAQTAWVHGFAEPRLQGISTTQNAVQSLRQQASRTTGSSSACSPLTPPNRRRQSTSGRSSSGRSSTDTNSPFGHNSGSSRSSCSATGDGPSAVVCELPASLTFDDVPANTGNDHEDVKRKEEAQYWGDIATKIYQQQLEDPFYTLGLGAFCRSVPPRVDNSPQATTANALGIFESSVPDEASLHSVDQCLRYYYGRPSASNIEDDLDTVDSSSDIQGFHEDSEVPNDDSLTAGENSDSRISHSWERALESQEQTFKNEIEDLKEDHTAEIDGLQERIHQLEAEVKAVKGRKAYVEKVANKKASKQDAEIAAQRGSLEAAYADILSKDIEIQEKKATVDRLEQETAKINSQLAASWNQLALTQRWEVEPLRQEVTRLTALNFDNEQRIQSQAVLYQSLRKQIETQPNVAELQAALTDARHERDAFKAQYEDSQELFHQTTDQLVKAQELINNQQVRLYDYRAEHEDHPACGAETDGLLKQKDDAYQLLEKKANDTFMLWKKGNESREHEKIMHNACVEELNCKIDNLEGDLNYAQDESARLTAITEDYIAQVETETGNPDQLQRKLLEASQNSVDSLKKRLNQKALQIAVCEKDLAKERAEVKTRDLILAKKDSELQALESEKVDAERAVENLESKLEFREADFQDELDAKNEELRDAWDQVEGLQHDLRAIAQSVDASSAATTIEAYQSESKFFQQQVDDLVAEKQQREIEQHNRDFHEATCAASSERNAKIQQQNWENAQLEIKMLKRHIQLIDQGCDPEKFDLAQQYEELRLDKDALEQKLCGEIESMTATMKEYTAATKAIIAEEQTRIRTLSELAQTLCAYLREAWSVDENVSYEDLVTSHERQETLDEIEAAVLGMLPEVPAMDAEEEEEAREDWSGDYEHEDEPVPYEFQQAADLGDLEGGDWPLDVPPSQLPDPWEYITGDSHSAMEPSAEGNLETSGATPEPSVEEDTSSESSATEKGCYIPGAYPDSLEEHGSEGLEDQPGPLVTVDHTTNSGNELAWSSDQYTAEASSSEALPSKPSTGQEQSVKNESVEVVEAELISPHALRLQQDHLTAERGWTTTEGPEQEWGHQTFHINDLEQAWEAHHNHGDEHTGQDLPIQDPSSQIVEDTNLGGPSHSAENGSDTSSPNPTTPPTPSNHSSQAASSLDTLLPPHYIHSGRGRYLTYGDFTRYWHSIEAELHVDDGIDHWAAAVTDVPGYVEDTEGPFMMSGALPTGDEVGEVGGEDEGEMF